MSENKLSTILIVLGVTLFISVCVLVSSERTDRTRITADEFLAALEEQRVATVIHNIPDNTVHGSMLSSDGEKMSYYAYISESVYFDQATPLMDEDKDLIREQSLTSENSLDASEGFMLISSGMCFLFAYLNWRSGRQTEQNEDFQQRMQPISRGKDNMSREFGSDSRVGTAGRKSRSRSDSEEDEGAAEENKVMFSDIAGVDEALAEVMEIEEFLSNPEKFRRLGAKTPHGIMLAGEPGCGKTMMAKALANESGAAFFSVSGSDFMEMYVGVGAARVRSLFKEARENVPAILFIDEIDAVGKKRSAAGYEGHGERDQTLNQILTEMDGFGSSDDVIVVAATNRIDTLDDALLRPGRFDRHIFVDKPDKKGRIDIINVHSRGKPISEDVDIEYYGTITAGMSGADLANLMNEAAIFAARRNALRIEPEDMNDAFERVVAGAEKARVLSDAEKRTTAYHEAGHAVVGYVLPGADKVSKISIISRGQALGYTLTLPENDTFLHTRKDLENKMAMMLGGYVAEELVNDGNTSTGPSNDLERVTAIARAMVTQYGMDEDLGYRCFSRERGRGTEYGTDKERQIDEAVDILVRKAHDRARSVIESHYPCFEALARALMDHEVVEGEEMDCILMGCDDSRTVHERIG